LGRLDLIPSHHFVTGVTITRSADATAPGSSDGYALLAWDGNDPSVHEPVARTGVVLALFVTIGAGFNGWEGVDSIAPESTELQIAPGFVKEQFDRVARLHAEAEYHAILSWLSFHGA
jgi:hypothetical protein